MIFEELISKYENKKSNEKKLNQTSGIVYTPERIVDFIVKNIFKTYFNDFFNRYNINLEDFQSNLLFFDAIQSYLTKNTEMQKQLKKKIETIKILDPACGTGRFLISIAQFLLKMYQIFNYGASEIEIKKKILQNNLYGVEIDKSAFEITKLRFLYWLYPEKLSISENNAEDLFNLNLEESKYWNYEFDLNINIFRLDFLINFKFYDFDIVIGNPPYIENKKIENLNYKKELGRKFKSAYKLYDFSILFIEKSIEVLKHNDGYLSFIMPNKFLAADYGLKIRHILINETSLRELIDLSSLPIFYKTAIYPIIISLKNAEPTENHLIRIRKVNDLKELSDNINNRSKFISQKTISNFPNNVIPLIENINLLHYLYSNFKPMSNVLSDLKIIYRPFGFLKWAKNFKNVSECKNSDKDLLLIGTGNVGKYFIKFEKHIKISKNDIEISFYKYYDRDAKLWKELSGEKLIFREIAKDLTWVYDPGIFTNITGLYLLRVPSFDTNKLFGLLTIMNSKFIDTVFKLMYGTLHMSGGYLRVNGSFIKRLPLPDQIPHSISYLGKILQFLYQLNYEFTSKNRLNIFKGISIQTIKKNIEFYEDLTNSLINQLYLKRDGFKTLDRILNSPNKFPEIIIKYFIPRFNLSKFETYDKEELDNYYYKINQTFEILSKETNLMKQIEASLKSDLLS